MSEVGRLLDCTNPGEQTQWGASAHQNHLELECQDVAFSALVWVMGQRLDPGGLFQTKQFCDSFCSTVELFLLLCQHLRHRRDKQEHQLGCCCFNINGFESCG